MINGVKIIPIKRHADNRGFLSEVFRASGTPIDVMQVNFTVAHPGVIKAFHYHDRQDDYWFCTHGNIEVVLFDVRSQSETCKQKQSLIIGDMNSCAVLIPRGVAHGYRVLGNKEAGLVYLVNNEYDTVNPDELRIAHDSVMINHNWSTEPR